MTRLSEAAAKLPEISEKRKSSKKSKKLEDDDKKYEDPVKTMARRKFEDVCEQNNVPAPSFKVGDGHVTVSFKLPKCSSAEDASMLFLRLFDTMHIKNSTPEPVKPTSSSPSLQRSAIFAGNYEKSADTEWSPMQLTSPRPSTKNYISVLMEYHQKRGMERPEFTESDPVGNQFVCKCVFDGNTQVGTGSSKKSAKNDAARLVVEQLGSVAIAGAGNSVGIESLVDGMSGLTCKSVNEKSMVNTVQEWFQRRRLDLPKYNAITISATPPQFQCSAEYVVSSYHPDHPINSTRLLDEGQRTRKTVMSEVCSSKKDAKNNCAQKLWQIVSGNV